MVTPERSRQALVALRLVLGVTAYVAPDLAARVFGIDPDESAAMPSAVRLFGAREAAMGVVLATASDRELRRWLMMAAAVDALDVVTVALGHRARRLRLPTIVVGGGLASVAVALGLRALGGQAPRRRRAFHIRSIVAGPNTSEKATITVSTAISGVRSLNLPCWRL